MNFTPFAFSVSQAEISDLHARLDRVRWPDQMPDTGWDYGAPILAVKQFCDYWRNSYQPMGLVERLGQWPQFTTTIDGQQVHFAHIRSPHPNAFPLMITHGWPGSLVEFLKIVGPLVDPVRSHSISSSRRYPDTGCQVQQRNADGMSRALARPSVISWRALDISALACKAATGDRS
jgi:hypothetical protein